MRGNEGQFEGTDDESPVWGNKTFSRVFFNLKFDSYEKKIEQRRNNRSDRKHIKQNRVINNSNNNNKQ